MSFKLGMHKELKNSIFQFSYLCHRLKEAVQYHDCFQESIKIVKVQNVCLYFIVLQKKKKKYCKIFC